MNAGFRRNMRALVGASATAIMLVLATPVFATAPRDGWASWQIDASEGAPAWCCFDWEPGNKRSTGCALDDRSHNFSHDDDAPPATKLIVYAKYAAGAIVDARACAPDCPVKASTPIIDLGIVSNDASLDSLLPVAASSSKQREHLMPVLAVHAGARAFKLLDGWAAPGGERELRKEALFWLGQVRAVEASTRIRSVLTNDADAALREHATFVAAQTRLPWRDDALIAAARADKSRQVRGQAWFWFAQTGSTRAETAVSAALRDESDAHVREQAIFALSQLPKPRGTNALIGLIDNRELKRGERKHALFWLAQSDDERAYNYLDRALEQAAN